MLTCFGDAARRRAARRRGDLDDAGQAGGAPRASQGADAMRWQAEADRLTRERDAHVSAGASSRSSAHRTSRRQVAEPS